MKDPDPQCASKMLTKSMETLSNMLEKQKSIDITLSGATAGITSQLSLANVSQSPF
jgi:hypothetical protein